MTRRRVATRTRDARRSHREVTISPDTVRASRRQEVEAVDHGSTSDGVVGARHAETRSQWQARVAVEGKRVERTVGNEAVAGRLVVLVTIVTTRTRGHSRRVTSSLG